MKTILLSMAVSPLIATVAYGQATPPRVGSVEAEIAAMKDYFRKREAKAERKKNLETGRKFFGADERWSKAEENGLAGPYKSPSDPYEVGDWGCTGLSFRVLNKVSETECLVVPKYKGREAEVLLIRGLNTSKVTDGAEFILQHPFVIQETYNYTAVSGARKTVVVLECSRSKFDEFLAKKRAEAEAALFRNWSDSTGKFSVVAKFIEFKNGQAHLERKDNGKQISISMSGLSEEDQKWIRDELKRQREEEKSRSQKERKARRR